MAPNTFMPVGNGNGDGDGDGYGYGSVSNSDKIRRTGDYD